jgi:hypothetical protein
MTQATRTAIDLCGHLKGDPVIVAFSDGGEPERGILVDAGWDAIEVLQTDGKTEWTRRFSLSGDADTPHVTAVWIATPQTEALF